MEPAKQAAIAGEPAAHATHVVLYDGVCAMCNWFVRFILARDRARRFRFASLQSAFARAALARYEKDPGDLDTVYVVANQGTESEHLLYNASAALFVCRELGGAWRVAALLRLLSLPVLNALYRVVVRNRYRWFGKYDSCPLPDPRERDRFIDVS